MMTKRSAVVFNVFSNLIICLMFLWLVGGCCKQHQPGETLAEGDRRHQRNLSINQQNLSGDIDRALLFDKPSKAAPLIIPPPVEPQGK